MNAKNKERFHSVLLAVLLAVVVTVAVPCIAQEEPTPIPEPAQEEPVVTPDEPAAPAEPAAAAEPAVPAAPAEPAVPVVVAEPSEKGVPTVYRDKTRITVNGRAEMNGFIEFVVQPNNEDPTKVRANIIAKTKTKKITKELVGQLVFALGDRYKVKQTGDKTILVKSKNKKTPPVSISLMTQNLAGVSIMIGQG